MTLQPADLDRLEQLAREATPETEGHWRYRRSIFDKADKRNYAYVEWGKPDHGLGTGTLDLDMARYIAALSPAVVSELVAAARLGAAWQEAEAALPEYWRIRSLIETPGKLVGWEVVAAGDQRLVTATGPTPAAALLALAEALRGRP